MTPETSFAKEELMVVQTVSKDRRSFVLSKGLKDGIMKGQESVFANENVSIVCKVSLVDRNYSLWVPIDQKVTVPFNKEDIVSANSSVYGDVALDVISNTDLKLKEKEKMQVAEIFAKSNSFDAKVSYNRGLSQSSTFVSQGKNPVRTGYNYAINFNHRFLPEFELSAGFRVDNEVYRIEEPELDIPTTRKMITAAATYHFLQFSNGKNNLFLSIAAGYGTSSTDVNEDVATGRVTLLPEVRIGYLMPFSKSMKLIVEASVESLSTTETFEDGVEQSTNSINSRISVGIRF